MCILIFLGFSLFQHSVDSSPANDVEFNLAADFSPTQNPNGQWAYGFINAQQLINVENNDRDSRNVGTALSFVLYNQTDSVSFQGDKAFGWRDSQSWDVYGRVLKNLGPNQLDLPGWDFYMEHEQVVVGQALAAGIASAVRWSAPVAGLYNIDTRFTSQGYVAPNLTLADVYIIQQFANGSYCFLNAKASRISGFMGRAVNLYQDGVNYPQNEYRFQSRSLSLAAGDRIYLVVGTVSQQIANVGIECKITINNPNEFLSWWDCGLPANQYIAVHAESRQPDGSWGNDTEVLQPFRSQVDRLWNRVYWRKDSEDQSFYGELYTFDSTAIRLHTETFPAKTVVDPPTQPPWDARVDRMRLFLDRASGSWSLGRVLAPAILSDSWAYKALVDTHMSNNWSELNDQTAPLFQSGVNDDVNISSIAPFSTVFDGLCSGWSVCNEFTSFDEALVINQHMNLDQPNPGRERFFFAKKNGTAYGIVRWDNSALVNGAWVVTDRTVGLCIQQDAGFSMKQMELRVLLDRWIAPFAF